MNIPNDLITLAEAVERFEKSEVTIRAWLTEECIINYVPGTRGRQMRFSYAELDAAKKVQYSPKSKPALIEAIKAKKAALRKAGHLRQPHESIAA